VAQDVKRQVSGMRFRGVKFDDCYWVKY
jgi:hypothetical protein